MANFKSATKTDDSKGTSVGTGEKEVVGDDRWPRLRVVWTC